MAARLFTNAWFFLPGGRFESCSLLVEGGSIVDVLPELRRPSPEPTGARRNAGTSLPEGTRVIDLAGRHVTPGFIDAHFHLLALALKGLRCDLSAARSARDVAEALFAWEREHPGGEPLVGVDWDESGWTEPVFPTKRELDDAIPGRPVFARRICGHVGVANSAFLDLMTAPRDFIDRDTGFVSEDAVVEASKLGYPPRTKIEKQLEGAIGALHRLGVTSIHDVVGTQNYDAYLAGIRSSRHPLRIEAFFHADPGDFDRLKERASVFDEDLFRAAGIKIFCDGSLGGRTAALNSAYADAPTIGEFLVTEDSLAASLERCVEKGITCMLHAIGDRALRTILLETQHFPPDTRLFRIEHAEVIGWDEMKLLAKSPVSLCMQPNFVRNWQAPGGLYERRLGKSRWRRCNPFRTLADLGVRYAFGSDGMPPGPLYGIKGATEHPLDEERIATAEAIRRYTETANTLSPNGRRTGQLKAGFFADMAVLSGNPLDTDPDVITVERTYLGGEEVYDGRRGGG